MHHKELKSMAFSHAQLRKRLSLEYASNFQTSESLIFTVNDAVTVEGEKLTLQGKLANPTSESISIIVFPVHGNNPFYMKIKPGQNITPKPHRGPPLPQQVPPPPAEFIVPAMTQVEFITKISLRKFVYSGAPTAELEWSFHYWNNPITGILSVALPNRAK
jgi:hypothetical protein